MATAREGRGRSGRRERRRGRPSRRGRRARGLPRASEPPRGARRAGWSGKGTLVRSLGAPGVERGGIAARTSRKNFLERAFASGRLLEKTGAPAGALRPWLVASRASELRSAIGSGRGKRAPHSRDGDRLAREWEISISHLLSGADSPRRPFGSALVISLPAAHRSPSSPAMSNGWASSPPQVRDPLGARPPPPSLAPRADPPLPRGPVPTRRLASTFPREGRAPRQISASPPLGASPRSRLFP